MYVYIMSEKASKDNNYKAVYTVGFYEPTSADLLPRFKSESDWNSRDEAAARVSYLNGGSR